MKIKRSVFRFTVDSYKKSKTNIVENLINQINEAIPAENIINVQMHTDYENKAVRDKDDMFEHMYFPGKVWMEVYHRVEEDSK